MHQRALIKFRPGLERLEAKQLLSAISLRADALSSGDASRPLARTSVDPSGMDETAGGTSSKLSSLPTKFLAFRITNTPWQTPVDLYPPFQQVLVQNTQPVPGQVYNVLYVAVKNGTAQTFTARNGFEGRLSTQAHSVLFPILTGTQQWKPRQWLVFYVLTKEYYPLPEVAGGFQLFLGGRKSTLVPGPSGIFLRLKYNPATFARTLDWIVAFGQGSQLGKGAKVGLPDTAINEIVAARTLRHDFGGHF
jgi:hypothetical protein